MRDRIKSIRCQGYNHNNNYNYNQHPEEITPRENEFVLNIVMNLNTIFA